MITGGTGGANTLTGLIFEGKVDLKTFLNQQPGYKVMGSHVFYLNEEVGQIFKKTRIILPISETSRYRLEKLYLSQITP